MGKTNIEPLYDIIEFIAGQRACRDTGECPSNASESFKAGFGAQYELEQMMNKMTEGQE